MATITHRVGLGRNLTAAEVDANFDGLNTEVGGKAPTSHSHDAATSAAAGFMSAANAVDLARSAKLRTEPLRVATFGDSTSDTNSSIHDMSVVSCTFASPTTYSISPEKFLLPTFYSQAYLVGNGGIGGQTAAQMIARDGLSSATTRKAIADIIALRPDVVLLRGGSINDFVATTGDAGFTAQIATTYENHLEVIHRFISAGITVIDSGLYGYSGTTWADATRTRAAIVTLNGMWSSYAATLPGNKYRFLSWTGILADSSGAFLTNCALADSLVGVHLSLWGQYLASQQEAAAIESLFGASSGPRYAGTNLLKSASTASYGGNSTTFANVSGGIPTGLSWGYSNSTSQAYAIEILSGKKWATFTNTPSAVNANSSPYFDLDLANFAPAVGDVYGLEFDLRLTSASGGAPPDIGACYSRIIMTKTSGGTISVNAHQISYQAPFGGAYQAKVIFPPFRFPADTTTFSSVEFMAQITNATTTPLKVWISSPRMVKLEQTLTLI
jgi:hypothetical protein